MESVKCKYLKRKDRTGKSLIDPLFLVTQQPVLIKENSIIDYIDFNPNKPHNFAVTCSVRIQIYNPITKDLSSTFSQFNKSIHGGTFGKNGQLLVCGDDEGCVKLFETSTKRALRSFKEHTAPVHRTFFTADKQRIASFSDDKSVRLWDIANETCVQTFENAHSDYVRAGCVSPVSPDILLSGGYDHKVKMYDTRTESAVFEVNHGSPVHSVLFLPTGGIFISCGASHVKLWDAFAGGRLIAMMSSHNKDIKCLRLACNGRRLLSGGLDRKVKIYDTSTYQTVHSLDFSNQITSMAVAPDDETLVVGMVDGIVSVQRMDSDRKMKTLEKKKVPKTSTSTDQFVDDYKKPIDSTHDKKLRKYEYIAALKTVLTMECMNRTPHITVGVISELMRRKGLHRALEGQTIEFTIKFITFLGRYIGDGRFMKTLVDVSNVLLDVYGDDFSNVNGLIGKKLMEFNQKLKREENLLIDCMELLGAFELLFAGADVDEQSVDTIQYSRELDQLKPSDSVQNFVVTLDD